MPETAILSNNKNLDVFMAGIGVACLLLSVRPCVNLVFASKTFRKITVFNGEIFVLQKILHLHIR